MLYDIDVGHYVKTIHEHPEKGYYVTSDAATIYLHIKTKYKEGIVDDDFSKESSDLSNMSRYQLIARLHKLGDISDSDKGPAPQIVKDRVLTLLSFNYKSDSIQEADNSG